VLWLFAEDLLQVPNIHHALVVMGVLGDVLGASGIEARHRLGALHGGHLLDCLVRAPLARSLAGILRIGLELFFFDAADDLVEVLGVR